MKPQLAKVKCEVGRTISLGVFENVRIHAGLERMCVDDRQEIDETFEKMVRWCTDRVKEKEAEWKL